MNKSDKGEFIAPIFVLSTPGGELAMLKTVAENEVQPGLKFKVVKSGGRTVRRQVQGLWSVSGLLDKTVI